MSNNRSIIDHHSLESQKLNRRALAHTLDRQRRAALANVDHAKFSRFHCKVALVAGVGFFTDAYDLFAIDIASIMLGYLYGPNGTLTANQDLGIKAASPIGTLVGQLVFGCLADIVGRKRMYGVEMCIVVVATFAQVLSGHGPAANIIGVLVVWRFILGIGIGGDYPLSAIITSEFAPIRTRGRLMTAVVSSQGWGNLAAGLVSLVVIAAFKMQIRADDPLDPRHVDSCWRLLIGLGCIPGAVALYFRLTIPETPRFTMDIERNIKQASQDVDTFLTSGTFLVDADALVQRAAAPKASLNDFIAYFRHWKNRKVLIGTCYSWFAVDIAFYGLGLNSGIILQAIGFRKAQLDSGGGAAIYQNLINVSVGSLVLSLAGLIPGYWATFFLIDSWGRQPIQLLGFVMLTIIFVIMGFAYDAILARSQAAFVLLYCMANFFSNFGPNATTFIIPGESFPTRYRSTAHGISAASGKLGAVIAQVGFSQLKDVGGPNKFVKHILQIFSLFMLTGVFSTLLLKEPNQRSLEELSNENQDSFISGFAGTLEVQEVLRLLR